MNTGPITELQRRADNAATALERAAQRALVHPDDTTASLDVETHADAVRSYTATIAALEAREDLPYAGGAFSFYGDLIANAKHKDRDAWARLQARATDYRSTTGSYGALVAPRYLPGRITDSGHSRRPLCDLLAEPLPPTGTPVLLTRVTTAATAELQATQNTAATADSPASTETTLQVQAALSLMDVSEQLLQRSDPEGFDRMVNREVVGSVDALQESTVITDLLATSGAGSYALTGTTAYDFLDALSRVSAASHEAAGVTPDVVVVAPRRLRWLQTNAGDRSAAFGPGTILGMTLVESPSVPLTESTNQDRVLVGRREDLYLAEGPTNVEVVRDAANQAPLLHARIRAHRYFSVGCFRPAGLFVMSGAGLANPY